MTPFQSVRLWARRAPVAERVTAAVASAAAVAVLLWLAVPAGSRVRSVATSAVGGSGLTAGAPGSAAGGPVLSPSASTGGGGAGGAAATTVPGGGASAAAGPVGPAGTGTRGAVPAPGVPGPAGSGVAAATCASPPGSAPGITASTIKIAVTLTNIFGPAGNETFGGRPASEAQTAFQDVVDSINAAGGIACRKVVPLYYDSNPADQSDMQAKCLSIVQANVFAEIDTGGESLDPGPTCFGQNHIPYIDTVNLLTEKEIHQFYPYMIAPFATFDLLYHNTILALRDRGFFSAGNGFSKLGFVYLSCHPENISEVTGLLQQVGVASTQIVTYDLGCPSTGLANPSDIEQAVLAFKTKGVTHVTTADMAGSFSNFTTIAGQQGFQPKYGIPDEAVIAISYGNQHPDYNNIDGAIAIGSGRYGEEKTPSLTPTAATQRCNTVFTSHGMPTLYAQGVIVGANYGAMCDQMWLLKAAVEHEPSLSREAIVTGLQTVRSIDFSYPLGPNDWSASAGGWGGQYWRTMEFHDGACACWQVVDATFRPSYP